MVNDPGNDLVIQVNDTWTVVHVLDPHAQDHHPVDPHRGECAAIESISLDIGPCDPMMLISESIVVYNDVDLGDRYRIVADYPIDPMQACTYADAPIDPHVPMSRDLQDSTAVVWSPGELLTAPPDVARRSTRVPPTPMSPPPPRQPPPGTPPTHDTTTAANDLNRICLLFGFVCLARHGKVNDVEPREHTREKRVQNRTIPMPRTYNSDRRTESYPCLGNRLRYLVGNLSNDHMVLTER